MELPEAIRASASEVFDQFENRPFDLFNERDAISRFLSSMRNKAPDLFEPNKSHAAHSFSLLHEEYPIPSFITTTIKGRFDIVVLNEEFIKANTGLNLTRPGGSRHLVIPQGTRPFKAIIEFKFLYEAPGRVQALEQDLAKLSISSKYSDYCCFIYMQRLLKNVDKWDDHLAAIQAKAESYGIPVFVKAVSPHTGG